MSLRELVCVRESGRVRESMCVCVCVCVRVREWKSQREYSMYEGVCVRMKESERVCACVCVLVREREVEGEIE